MQANARINREILVCDFILIMLIRLNFQLFIKVLITDTYFGDWGLGDWGLGIGDWGLGPIPNPQSPIPKFNYCKVWIYRGNVCMLLFKLLFIQCLLIPINSGFLSQRAYYHEKLLSITLSYQRVNLKNVSWLKFLGTVKICIKITWTNYTKSCHFDSLLKTCSFQHPEQLFPNKLHLKKHQTKEHSLAKI